MATCCNIPQPTLLKPVPPVPVWLQICQAERCSVTSMQMHVWRVGADLGHTTKATLAKTARCRDIVLVVGMSCTAYDAVAW